MDETVTDGSPYIEANIHSETFIPTEESRIITDEDIMYYDMSGDKYLVIFNHFEYEKTRYFNYKKPSDRNGTEKDVERLKKVFGNLGFKITTHDDFSHGEIFDAVVEFSKLNHKATSCVCFAFLTHGDKCGDLYARDRTYQFRDVTMMIESGDAGLVGKPKLFFVQACRGRLVDDGRRLEMDGSEATFVIPTHADFLVLYSTVEDYVSFRDRDGSFMIQELCNVIEEYQKSWDLLHMITLLHRRVAYNKITFAPSHLAIHDKKQMPETRYSLTKLLKF
ncbi:caspase-1-like [Danaus plexippus]|uniref:caspase-1-like n=1 Tax=Danaus plexippus TaxID=13037 RepID=UPI002AB0C5B5|nr:caspase-1-like [Danaus plexippus]